nr:hypothetical protein [Tanacetum cinerariifolium]
MDGNTLKPFFLTEQAHGTLIFFYKCKQQAAAREDSSVPCEFSVFLDFVSAVARFYRSNPRYAIKECSSYATLYTRDCGCSKRNVEDKIHVPKPPKNCARCTRCGYLVDGPNCQGCALLRQQLEENLVTHSPDFQNSSEPSNAS